MAIVCGPPAMQAQQALGRIAGRVVLEGSRDPVATASVMLFVDSDAAPGTPLPQPLQTSTDRDGQYVLDKIPPGRYRLLAMKPGFIMPGQSSTRLEVGAGQVFNDALIVLQRAVVFAVSGRVLDPAGHPLPGAVVKVFQRAMMREGAATIPTTAPPATTNPRGEYRIVEVPAGQYCVVASYPTDERGSEPPASSTQTLLAPTFFPSTRDIAAARLVSSGSGDDVRGIDITMVSTRAFVVSGSVAQTGGLPLSGAAVTLIVWPTSIPARAMTGVPGGSAGYADRWAAGVPAAADGTFSIANVPSGTYRLTASSSPFGPGPLLQASMILTVDASLTGLELTVSSVEPMMSPASYAPAHRVSLAGTLDGEPITLTLQVADGAPLSATLVFTSKPNPPIELTGSQVGGSIQLSSDDINIYGTFDGRALSGTCRTPKSSGPCRLEVR